MADWDRDISNSIGMGALYAEDYQEEEVWAVMKEKEGSSPSSKASKKAVMEHSSSTSSWRMTAAAAPRAIPRAKSGSSSSSSSSRLESTNNVGGVAKHLSAPMNIPNWSSIYRNKNAVTRITAVAAAAAAADDDDDCFNKFHHRVVADAVDEDDDGDEMVPPHEYIDRRLKRTHIVSYSMLEGVGRTLKGRDLSKLRNAILYKTGFLE